MNISIQRDFPKSALPDFYQWIKNDPTPVRKMTVEQFVQYYTAELERSLSWVILVDGVPKGIVTGEAFGQGGDPTPVDCSGTIALAPEVRGQRVLQYYLPIAIEEMFELWPQVNRISTMLIQSNWPERKLLEKLRFQHEGTLREATELDGKLHDLVIYGLTRKDYFDGLLQRS